VCLTPDLPWSQDRGLCSRFHDSNPPAKKLFSQAVQKDS
jgi:hypothetical protein